MTLDNIILLVWSSHMHEYLIIFQNQTEKKERNKGWLAR